MLVKRTQRAAVLDQADLIIGPAKIYLVLVFQMRVLETLLNTLPLVSEALGRLVPRIRQRVLLTRRCAWRRRKRQRPITPKDRLAWRPTLMAQPKRLLQKRIVARLGHAKNRVARGARRCSASAERDEVRAATMSLSKERREVLCVVRVLTV